HREKSLSILESFLQPFDIVDYDSNASIEYGKIRADLEKQGKVIGSLDMMIAGHGKSIRATLITNNVREFERVKGLDIENWVY
ncbi:MAG: PIN domain-containing protein, partial [Campylobacterales bacterium]|nr:PIN domain-containing protein [Campylobacterales bacterium]